MNSNCKYVLRRRPGASGVWAYLLAVAGAVGLAAPAHAAFEATSRSLIAAEESCPNGAIDPGETNTVTFVVKNTTGGTLNNVRATLLNSGNVAFATSGELSLGSIPAGSTASVNLRFRAGGSCGGSLIPTVRFVADNATAEDKAFDAFQLGSTITQNFEFSNTGSITISDFTTAEAGQGRANPYPSSITVSGVPNQNGPTGERVSGIRVTLRNLSHSFSKDINAVLVSPKNHKILLLREVGGSGGTAGVSDATLTFVSNGTSIPANTQIPGGASTIAPTTHGGTGAPNLPSPIEAAPYDSTLASVVTDRAANDTTVTGRDPNGAWRLFIQDDQTGDSGVVAGGWTLNLTTTRISCCGAGETFPYITKDGKPSINQVEVNEDAENTVVSFNVNDIETTPGSLVVTASSSDETLVKSSEIAVEGDGGSRSIKVKKIEANRFGTTIITLNVTDGSGRSSSLSFNFKVNSVNDAPTFPTFVRNQQFNQGATTPPLPFTVADVETPSGDIIVTGTSSDETVVPNQNIIFGIDGSGNRTVQLIPTDNDSTTITLTARDGNGAETSRSFLVNFSADPGDPTISPIDSTSTNEDTAKDIAFTVRTGSNTSVNNLILSAATSNSGVLPVGNIVFSGSGTERTVRLTPVANQHGSATVTISVADPIDTTSRVQSTTFTLTVNSVNDLPTISAISDRTINEDSNTGDISFTVGDVANETAVANLTLSAASSSTAVVPVANVTFGGSGANRTVKVTPAPDAFGKSTITVTVGDGNGGTTSTQFVVTVNGINDDPTIARVRTPDDATTTLAADASPTAETIEEDVELETVDGVTRVKEQTLTLEDITAGAGDESEQTVTIVSALSNNNVIESIRIKTPDNAQVKSPTTTATLAYRPKRNAYGTTEVTLTLTDNADGARTITRKFKIDVTAKNDEPTIANIPNQPSRSNQQGIQVPLSVSDVETPASQLSVVVTSDNQNIVRNENITVNSSRNLIAIVPQSNATGTATITVTVTDRGPVNNGNAGNGGIEGTDGLASATDTFTVTFDDTPINNPPNIRFVTGPNPGDRADSLTLAIDEEGLADATVDISDDGGVANVSVSGVSSNPAIVSNILVGNLIGNTRSIAIVPNANANGNVTITITATDGNGLSSTPRTINLTVRPVEDNPTITLRGALSDGTHTALEDANPVKDGDNNLEIAVGDAETALDSLVVTASSSNPDLIPNDNITVSQTGSVRTLTIRPAAHRSGSSTISLTVTDGAGRTAGASFTLTITAVNDAPELAAISDRTIDEDATTQTVSLSGIKAGGNESQTLTVTARSDNTALIPHPSVAHTSPTETGSISFTPTPNASGSAKITVTVTDNGGTDNGGVDKIERSFVVTVRAVNDQPQILNALADISDGVINQERGPITITISDTETTTPAQLTLSFSSSNTALVPNTPQNLQETGSGPNRGLIIRPALNASGTADITVTVRDPDGGSSSKTFRYTVAAGVQPVISAISDITMPRNSFSSIINFTVTDAQSPASDLTFNYTSSNESAVPLVQFNGTSNNRQFIVRSGAISGVSTITFTARDPQGNVGTRTFRVTVLGNNPTITAIADINIPRNGSSGALPFTISDGNETFPGFLALSATSSNPQLVSPSGIVFGGDVNSGARTVTVTPLADRGGVSDIVITVTDGDGQTATESFRVTVPELANTPPTISSIGSVTIDRNSNTGLISFTVTDAQTPPADLVVTATASDTTLIPTAGGIFLGGNSASRNITVTPAQNRSGTATITITVRDASNATASASFNVTVRDPAPTQNNITDLDGDGRTDLVFQTPDGFIAIWTITNGLTRTSAQFLSPNNVGDPRWRVFGSGDFNSDGHADLAFQHTDGTLAVWIMNRLNFVRGELLNPGNPGFGWRAVATVDYNRDGKMDILFQNADGTIGVWYMDGLNQASAAGMSPLNRGNPQWKVVGAGRIDGDQNLDLVFQHDDGTVAVWLMNGTTMVAPALLNPSNAGTGFRVVSVFNVDGQASADLLFHGADGSLAAWYMSGFDLVNAEFSNPSNADSTWRVVAP